MYFCVCWGVGTVVDSEEEGVEHDDKLLSPWDGGAVKYKESIAAAATTGNLFIY